MSIIVLDLYTISDYKNNPIAITKGETNIILIKLETMGLPYDLTDLSVRVAIKKSDWTIHEVEAENIKIIDEKNGLIEVTLIQELTDKTGMTQIQVQISDGERKLTWLGTIYFINRNPDEMELII